MGAVQIDNPIFELPVFAELDARERAAVARALERVTLEPGQRLLKSRREAEDLFIVAEGQLGIVRHEQPLTLLRPGDCVGRLKPARTFHAGWSVQALEPVVVLRLTTAALDRLSVTRPHATLRLLRNVTAIQERLLEAAAGTIDMLMRQNPRPITPVLDVRLGDGGHIKVRTGTQLRTVLPREINGVAVVAALLSGRYVSLNRPLVTASSVSGIVADSPLGRQTIRHSLSLLVLEAARRLAPSVDLRIGASLGFAHIIEVKDAGARDADTLARALHAAMCALIEEDAPFRLVNLTVAEAIVQFEAQGWPETVRVLDTWRSSTVTLVSCGELYALEDTPLVDRTGALRCFALQPHEGDLLLTFDNAPVRPDQVGPLAYSHRLAREHDRWLRALGAVDVGALNDLCAQKHLGHVIEVSEGFQEKRIGQIADQIRRRETRARVICVAGPSSAGKTTFIRRLSVQLRVNGINPTGISLDDYFLDRTRTPLLPNGNPDYESLSALDLELMGTHLAGLLAGERVTTARYDFQSGKNSPHGGPTLQLGDSDVLILEGIHGLNPELPGFDDADAFRIFVNPMTSLPIDPVTRVGASAVRLLRRIVRDRRRRGIAAADNIARWEDVRHGERAYIFPHLHRAHAVINTSLVYEPAVLKVFAERYLLEVPNDHPSYPVAHRLRRLLDRFVAISPDRVPANSLLREFIGGADGG